MRKNKKYCSLLVGILILCFITVQSIPVNASASAGITSQQVRTMMDGMDSIVTQLKSIGLDETDIGEIFRLEPRTAEFYTQKTESMPFSGSFATGSEEQDRSMNGRNVRSYDGNPPATNDIQKQRIENIYGTALQYYKTNYYEGNSANGEDFGNYLTYLYISHYIDGPGRAPTLNDFPYIISESDINAYKTFLKTSLMSSWATELAKFGSAIYSDIDYLTTVNAISTVDQVIHQGIDEIVMESVNGYNTADALSTISPLVQSYLVKHHALAANDQELTEGTIAYVSSQLDSLDFYKNFEKNITNTIIGILTTTLISAICGSVTLIGVMVSIVPLFVYEYTGLIQTAVLVKLQYSFSARYALRTGIYLGI